MKIRQVFLLCGFFAWAFSGCSADVSGQTTDLREADDYLQKWDRFAQGENQLAPLLRAERDRFEAALTRLLRAGDRAAPARMVFYAAVQVGGFFHVDSELGAAAAAILGPGFPSTNRKDGQRAYFAGELYFWWEENQERFEAYPLFDEWKRRAFAETVVIPFYRKICKHG